MTTRGYVHPEASVSADWVADVADPCDRTVGPDITEGYAIGETDFERWGRLWKARASDPELDGEEWVIFLERIQEHFRSKYENFPDEFYFWGDFSGDRTLDLRIAKPRVLTACLLSDLQEYLQTNGQKMWRIRIPLYFRPNDPRRVVVVYPRTMNIPSILPSGIRSSLDHCADPIQGTQPLPGLPGARMTMLFGGARAAFLAATS